MSDPNPSMDETLGPHLEYFGERLNRVFSYFFCVLEFEGDDDLRADPAKNSRAWMLQTIENACLDTTLTALRDLDDFLTPRKPSTRPDDIRASDFGYDGSHSYLSASERNSISKLIVHTTTQGTDTPGGRWEILELATKAVSQCLEFLNWVEGRYAGDFRLSTAALVMRNRTRECMDYVNREAARKRTSKTDTE